jgi:2'-hydroxyisoflavone reductase
VDILVLGGTVFLGRTVVETALAAGHEVTTFNRGRSGPPVQGAEVILGDRGEPADLARLAGRDFDLVVDTGYEPALVRAAAEHLEPRTARYAFVSSINAFRNWPEQPDYRAGGVHDGDPDAGPELPPGVPESAAYGWRKVGAERAALRAFGAERTSVLRAGLIVGRYDGVGRLPWWLDRIGRGGEVLAPGSPEDTVRMIDARDLAEFALRRPSGTFEASGPAGQTTRGELFALAREVTGSDARFSWLPDGFLRGRVEAWTEVPLWIPPADGPGLFAHDTTGAEAAGLSCRPVADTVAATWRWMQQLPDGWHPSARTPGLNPDREQELLTGWRVDAPRS